MNLKPGADFRRLGCNRSTITGNAGNAGTASQPTTIGDDSRAQSDTVLPCFHCGVPVPEKTTWSVIIHEVKQRMCCPGCQAVAQSIVDIGFADYYHSRTGYAANPSQHELVPPELRLYDNDAANIDQTEIRDELEEACYSVHHIRCAACVWLIERRLSRLPGVVSAEINASTEQLQIRWRATICKPSHILGAMRAIGYPAFPFDPVQHSEQLEQRRKKLFRQLFIAGLSMMQVMMFAFPMYLASAGEMDEAMSQLMRWASLLLTLPAVFYSAQPFFCGAWRDLRNRMPGMDIPVALGISAAFIGSTVATWQGRGDVYFDSVTMFILLLLCSRYLELTARCKAASELNKLQQSLPASALCMTDFPQTYETYLVAASALRIDDIVLIKPGEVVPADCLVLQGDSTLDMSLISGESWPQSASAHTNIPSGAVNITHPIIARVTQSFDQSTLSTLIALIKRAGHTKPRLALWADRVAAWFVVALMLFSFAVFLIWQWIDPTQAWPIAIAVLVVSCPCALSLAMPTALAASTNRLLHQGILVVQAQVLETMQRTTHFVFDKTGTLTQGKPALQQVVALSTLSGAECLCIAAALEQSSNHPLAQAIRSATCMPNSAIAEHIQHHAGQGLEAVVNGTCYRLGSLNFVRKFVSAGSVKSAGNLAIPGQSTCVYLAADEMLLARFDIADEIRPEALAVIQHFQQQGKQLVLLSGDRFEVAQHVASELSIPTVVGDCLPENKLSFIHDLQQSGAVVAMLGDGINDAAALQAADVSFAMGGGAALAQTHADCVLLSGRLSSLMDADNIAAKTLRVIRQNLAWATLYNVIAIPVAAFGWVNPWVSGVGMSLSSTVVVLNALRLRRAKV